MRAWMRAAIAASAIATTASAVPALASLAAPVAPFAALRIPAVSRDADRLCTNGSRRHDCPRPPADGLVVSIPAVAFTETVVAKDGRVRTPVVLADDTVTAQARVVGAATASGCTARLQQGVPAWLDCSFTSTGKGNPRIVVRLSDGRTAMKEITFG